MMEKISRRDLLKYTGTLTTAFLVSSFFPVGLEDSSRTSCKIGERKLINFSDKIKSGGQPPDGIPPIGEPRYVSADEADGSVGISEESIIFGVDYGNETKAFPRSIMVWHEIVNESIDGQNLSITYCPLTGSAIGYKGLIGKKPTTFGTSGKLLNSNLVMYDRLSGTKSYWPQILGRSVQGPQLGDRLDSFSVTWTTWGLWKNKHPNSQILTSDTGYIRDYGRDPYGSYQKTDTYYQKDGPMFSVMRRNDRFQPKKVVVGIKVKDCTLAVPKSEFKSKGLINTELGEEPIAIVYEEALDTVRAFSRKVGGSVREFELEGNKIKSRSDGTRWKTDGSPIEGKLAKNDLETVPFFDVMWFAWYSFYPETGVLEV